MSQPPHFNYYYQLQQHPQQQQFHPQYQQQQAFVQQHQFLSPPQVSPQQIMQQNQQLQNYSSYSREPHWFNKMCEAISSQQSRHEAGSQETPPMLTPGNYVQWASRFLRFVELKKPHGLYLKKVIEEGPYPIPATVVPATSEREETTTPTPVTNYTTEQTLQQEAN